MSAKIIKFQTQVRVVSSDMDKLFQVSMQNIRAVVRATYIDKPAVAVSAGEEAAIKAVMDGKSFHQAMHLAGDAVREAFGKCLSNSMKVTK
jgi:hypothetical protein